MTPEQTGNTYQDRINKLITDMFDSYEAKNAALLTRVQELESELKKIDHFAMEHCPDIYIDKATTADVACAIIGYHVSAVNKVKELEAENTRLREYLEDIRKVSKTIDYAGEIEQLVIAALSSPDSKVELLSKKEFESPENQNRDRAIIGYKSVDSKEETK